MMTARLLVKISWLMLAAAAISLADDAKEVSPCRATVAAMAKTPDFAPYYLASGHSLPMDAGKYVTCHSLKEATGARYFLVGMKAQLVEQIGTATLTPLQMGFCVPSVCDHDGMVDLITSRMVQVFLPPLFTENRTIEFDGAEIVQSLSLVSDVRPVSPSLDLKPVDAGGVAACVVLGVFVAIVLISTAIALFARKDKTQPQRATATREGTNAEQLLRVEEGGVPAQGRNSQKDVLSKLASSCTVKAFTLFGSTGSLTKLMEPAQYRPTDCLNGARVLSMAGIILGHTYIMPLGISGYANMEDVTVNPINPDVAEKNVMFQALIGTQTGVDTFFFLSGFLLAHLSMKEIRAGRMNVIAAIILRYLRLTPSLALVMMVFYKIWAFLGTGPFAVQLQQSIMSKCDGYWWTELTYTMNFVPFDSDKVCMGWSWYLGDDMIFFIITIAILPIYARKAWVGWATVITLTLLSFALTSYFMVKYDLDIYAFGHSYAEFSYWVYSKPYARIPAYFVGVMTAWLLDILEKRGITRGTCSHTAKAHMLATVAAVSAIAVLLFVVFIPTTDYGDHAKSWGVWNVVFVTLARPLFAAGWAVITLLCYYDYVPLLNGFLSHPCWTPLARLTYGAYLVHPLVIKLSAGNAMQFYTFNSMDLLYRFTGNALLSTLGSVCLWALCERPCMTIFTPSKKGKKAKREALVAGSESQLQKAKERYQTLQEASRQSSASTAAPGSAASSSGSEQSLPECAPEAKMEKA